MQDMPINGPAGSVLTKTGPAGNEFDWSPPGMPLADLGLYGEGYLESHFTNGLAFVNWSTEAGATVYNSDEQIVDVNDDGQLVVLHDGLYELQVSTFGYGNGLASSYAQTSVSTAVGDVPIGFAQVDLSSLSGEHGSNGGQPIKSVVPLRASTALKVRRAVSWTGTAPADTNFRCDVILVPLMLQLDT